MELKLVEADMAINLLNEMMEGSKTLEEVNNIIDNNIDNEIITLLEKASKLYNNAGNDLVKSQAKKLYDKANKLYLDNREYVSLNTLKCRNHIHTLFYPIKTYTDYSNCKKEYYYEDIHITV